MNEETEMLRAEMEKLEKRIRDEADKTQKFARSQDAEDKIEIRAEARGMRIAADMLRDALLLPPHAQSSGAALRGESGAKTMVALLDARDLLCELRHELLRVDGGSPESLADLPKVLRRASTSARASAAILAIDDALVALAPKVQSPSPATPEGRPLRGEEKRPAAGDATSAPRRPPAP